MRKIDIPKDLLEELYSEQLMTLQQIADEFGVNRQTISNKLREYGIIIRNSSFIREQHRSEPKKRVFRKKLKYRDKEDFQRVYSELKSLDKVAEHYGIDLKTAYVWKKRLGIETIKSYSYIARERMYNKPYMNKEWLEKMYARYSWEDLGKMLGVSPTTLSKWGVRFGIKTRSHSEQWNLKSKNGGHCISAEDFKIQTYLESYVDKKVSKIPKKLKQFILDLYGGCEADGCGEIDVLDLHHIDEDHTNNEPSNHACLCPNCHAKIHRLGVDFNSLVKHHRVWSDIVMENRDKTYQEAK